MRFGIMGAGAVGGYFGGRLAHAGEEVHFIARGAHLEALRSHGLRVDSIHGDFTVRPVSATDDPAALGPVDAVLVCVKGWQVPEAARALRPLVGPDTVALPLQNGVEAPDQLRAVLGKAPVVGGMCKIISRVVAPGHVSHEGVEPSIALGELDRRRTGRVEQLRVVLARAGIAVTVPEDIRVPMWEKFLFIAPVSGLGALTRVPLGALRSEPETRALLTRAMREVQAVAEGHGVALREDMVDRTLGFLDSLPPDGTASMQRDLMEGRPSELESQTGAVVRLGAAVAVATPVNAFIYHSLLPMERRARA